MDNLGRDIQTGLWVGMGCAGLLGLVIGAAIVWIVRGLMA
jgi:ABC-type dipeptide/oligopeptide/nickel transport system permease subunit